jgi:hypothetical protein
LTGACLTLDRDHYSWRVPLNDLALLLRLNKSWRDSLSADDLYQITRGWWVMSLESAQQVTRVFAVAGGVVREVYEPVEWLPSPIDGHENRIGFNGQVARDRDEFVGHTVAHLFRPGSANPVRYLPLAELNESTTADSHTRRTAIPPESVEPGLLERVVPLLAAFEGDLLWHQSRAGQELFHSNTIAWLLRTFPRQTKPLLDLLGGTHYDVRDVRTWRELHNLDIVIWPVDAHPKIVVENKIYSVPYPEQLEKYNTYPLPWSAEHGATWADDTRYVLLSLMSPSFPLPKPWVHVSYRDVADALAAIEAESLEGTAQPFVRYRALVNRLVELAEAVDPAKSLDEQFSVTDVVAQLPGGGLAGAIACLRFSGLAQIIQSHFAEPKSYVVGGDRGGIATYWRRPEANRRIGWQFQSGQLRYQITIEDGHLQGGAHRAAREALVEAEHLDFFDYAEVEGILGKDLRAKTYAPGKWLAFNPDFVYRHRPVKPTISTARLAEALVVMTRRVDHFADHWSSDTTTSEESP